MAIRFHSHIYKSGADFFRNIVPIFSAFTALSSCAPSLEEQFVAACDEAIKLRLIAPAGYRRIPDSGVAARHPVASAGLTQTALGLGLRLSQHDYDALGERDATPAIFLRVIDYDAPNAYNTPIRSKARCLFFSINGKFDSGFDQRIGVDFLESSEETRR